MRTFTPLRLALVALTLGLVGELLHAQSGNSVVVQTFTYGSAPEGRFVLPPLAERYEKVLMHYKLRCPYDAQCGEWDYLMYIYLQDRTGRIDSTVDTSYAFRVDGAALDSFAFMRGPSWRYFPRISMNVTRTATTRLDSAIVGTGNTPASFPFNGAERTGRTQYLWRASELTSAGLKAGSITGMRFNVGTPGTELGRLTVRMRHTSRDSLATSGYDNDGFTTVFSRDVRFTAAGWAQLDFPVSFAWNGSSNIVVDISFDNAAAGGTATQVMAHSTPYQAGVGSVADERSLFFEGRDYVEVPASAFSRVDSAITIAFWAYGNPAFQPQDQMAFEGVDAQGYRVLNVHLPWSDGTIYWDAGIYAGRYDRLSKAAGATDFEGKWSYWVFTKNVKTGSMKIYLNGVQWATASSKKKPMAGIAKFKIGAAANGQLSYDGNIDEFSVWNTEVDAATIRTWMGRSASAAQHPFRNNLVLHYGFNDNSTRRAADSSGNGANGVLVGPPGSRRSNGQEAYMGFVGLALRPNVVFEQGQYTSQYDTTVTTDSVPGDPAQIVRYRTTADSSIATDTMLVWPAYKRYQFNKLGAAVDSIAVAPDSVIRQSRTPYQRKFEIVNRVELGRYITPYGNGLSLGEGFTWTFDVSDFRPLLHDTVFLSAYNQQELVDMTFEFVKGTPPRDPISVTNLWNGGFGYGLARSIEESLKPIKVKIPANAVNSRVKFTPTGHGFGGTQNCAEFCPKNHHILVDGQERYVRQVWREDCGLNPVYPQGGTWVYNRTNWCPGAEVWAYDFELTPWVRPGDSVVLDYDVDPYTWNNQGSQPYYQIESQLITYGAPNFTLDASVEQIKAPSKTDLFRRRNPVCANPVITIKNTGSTPLTSLDIQFGVEGAAPSTYRWTGRLNFLESADVELGAFSWTGATPARKFKVTISNPNGAADEYANNNTKEASYDVPPLWQSKVVFELRTNNSGAETRYELRDATTGRLVWERNDLYDATIYRDTLTLPDGCYEFRLVDLGGDGLSWWANEAAGAGYMRVRRADNGTVLKNFNPDFGSEIYQQFTVGLNLAAEAPVTGEAPESSWMAVYPNPTSGEFTLDVSLKAMSDCDLIVVDLLGAEVYRTTLKGVHMGPIPIDLGRITPGTYIVQLNARNETLRRKLIVK